MFIGQVVLGSLLGASFKKYGNALPANVSVGAIVVICVYVSAFAWSWCALILLPQHPAVKARNTAMTSGIGVQ